MTNLEPGTQRALSDTENHTGVRLLANCVVGLGFSYRAFQTGLDANPHLIGCDAGSTDNGPFSLGAQNKGANLAARRDMEIMIEGALRKKAPLVIGTCGGSGSNVQVDDYLEMTVGILAKLGKSANVATIYSEFPAEVLRNKLDGRVKSLGNVPHLTADDVDGSSTIVAMMGVEPIMKAIEAGADIVLAGRCCDPAIYAGMPILYGVPEGVAWHAAKSIDKGYLATTDPAEGSTVMASVHHGSFTVEPMKESVACTVATVARQTLHENPDPFEIIEPGGILDTREARYTQVDDRRVQVTGSRFVTTTPYTLKLEGSGRVGHRAIMIAGMRDPRVLENLDTFITEFQVLMDRAAASMGLEPAEYSLRLRVYGTNAVLGDLEPERRTVPKEVCLIVDVTADSESAALALAGRAGPTGCRLDVFGGLGGGGNFAYPFSPSVISVGAVYRWTVWHTIEIDPDEIGSIFPMKMSRI
jgi:hypothetical protein